jgi:hypothetical protein
MASQQKLSDYLPNHLLYELLMLRFTVMRLRGNQDQLLWNALYESFGVHARNLYDFLRNDGDSRNFKASDYIVGFEVKDRNGVNGLVQTMHQQLLHLGKRRTANKDEKIDVSDIQKIAAWVETGIQKFLDELQVPYRAHWKPDLADPNSFPTTHLGDSSPQQSSFPTYIIGKIGRT